MTEMKKFLDQKGIAHLWSKINIEDYPNNQTLTAVINAIDETKADKTELPEKPLEGTTIEITPNEVLLAMTAGRPISLTHTDTTYGTCTFNYFAYNDVLDSITASINFDAGGVVFCAQLDGSISENTWTFIANQLLTAQTIDTTLTQSGAPADAKVVGDILNNLNDAGVELNNALNKKDEIFIITITDNDNNGYTADKTFEEIKSHAENNYTLIVKYKAEIGHLVQNVYNMLYYFQGMLYRYYLGLNNDGTDLEVIVLPATDNTLTSDEYPANAKATGEAIAQKTQVQIITWEADD